MRMVPMAASTQVQVSFRVPARAMQVPAAASVGMHMLGCTTSHTCQRMQAVGGQVGVGHSAPRAVELLGQAQQGKVPLGQVGEVSGEVVGLVGLH